MIRRLIVLLSLAALLASCTGDEPRTSKTQGPSPSASATATSASPSPSPSATPQATEIWALYELLDTEPDNQHSLGLYRRQLSGGRQARTSLSSSLRFRRVSADGRWIAEVRFSDSSTSLFVAPTRSLASIKRVATTRESIESVWFRDDASIFYVVKPPEQLESPATGSERFYSVNLDGSNRRLIATFDWDCCYGGRGLLAFNEQRQELVWTNEAREGAGGTRGLFGTNIHDGKTRSLMRERGFSYNQTAMTPDGNYFYYVKDDTRLIERAIAKSKERVVYRARSGEPVLEFLRVTPDGGYIAFQATQQPEFNGPLETKDAKTTTYRIRRSDGSRRIVRVEISGPERHGILSGISPDGRYVWLTTYEEARGADVLIEVSTRNQSVVADHRQQRAARFVDWISLPRRT